MATKLQCPQCGGELPASFNRGAKGVCPGCSKSFDAPRVTAIRKQGTIVRAKAYRPPPSLAPKQEQPASSKRWILALALLLLLVGAGSAFMMKRTPAEGTSPTTDQTASISAPTPDKSSAPKDSNGTPKKNPDVNDAGTKLAANSKTPNVAAPKIPANAAAVKDQPADGEEIATTVPKIQRPAPKIDPAPAEAPIAFAEMRVPAPGAGKLKQVPFSPNVDQAKVDLAIKKGQDYLKNNTNGWLGKGSHPLGYTSLSALALLETGVAPGDPMIQEAAVVARRLAQKHTKTYDISLAILFLDRLGDPVDEPLIRTLGLRLIAGQTVAHGWNYDCPLLPDTLETPLLTLLDKLRPEGQWQIPLGREPGKALVDLAIPIAKAAPERLQLDLPLTDPAAPKPAMKEETNVVLPFMLGDNTKLVMLLKDAPEQLKQLAVTQPLEAVPPGGMMPKQKPNWPPIKMPVKGGGFRLRAPVPGRDDNSNSQFAMLALWAARRHGLPVERTLLLSDQRYAMSQTPSGWGYQVHSPATPAMTCVGLLGLALGHGALLADGQAPVKGGGDPAIDRGLKALGDTIKTEATPPNNLYYLWSVERVAMLYQLKTINGKDWYAWGANHLIKTQLDDGSWRTQFPGGHGPPIDVSLGLLFLHRSNLVADLTERLQLHMSIQDERK